MDIIPVSLINDHLAPISPIKKGLIFEQLLNNSVIYSIQNFARVLASRLFGKLLVFADKIFLIVNYHVAAALFKISSGEKG